MLALPGSIPRTHPFRIRRCRTAWQLSPIILSQLYRSIHGVTLIYIFVVGTVLAIPGCNAFRDSPGLDAMAALTHRNIVRCIDRSTSLLCGMAPEMRLYMASRDRDLAKASQNSLDFDVLAALTHGNSVRCVDQCMPLLLDRPLCMRLYEVTLDLIRKR